jgi:hypothetical protein
MSIAITARKAPRKVRVRRATKRATRVPRDRVRGLSEPWERIQGDAMKERLLELAQRIVKLEAWGFDLGYVQLSIRVRRTRETGTSGNSWVTNDGTSKLSLTVGTNEAQAIGTLIHEYAHHACFRRGWKEEGHGVRFLNFERAAYEEYLGERLDVKAADAQTYGGTGMRHHRYAQLGAFCRQLQARLSEQKREAA